MNTDDLKQIKGVVKEVVDESLDDFAAKIVNPSFDKLEGKFNNLETRFDGLETRFDGLETRFDGLETRFDGLENKVDDLDKTVNNLPNKAFITDKLDDTNVENNEKFRKIEKKINILTTSQKRNKLLKDDEAQKIESLNVFPNIVDPRLAQ